MSKCFFKRKGEYIQICIQNNFQVRPLVISFIFCMRMMVAFHDVSNVQLLFSTIGGSSSTL